MAVLDDILNRRRGTMTRQEAVAPTPQQAMSQLSARPASAPVSTHGNAVEIPRRTHQSAAGGAMPVRRSTAPVATNGYTYDQAAEGMKRFHGNVDLYHRPVVSSEAMNNAGYNIPAGNTATVYSMQRGIKDKSGRVREVLYTPITATGEVMSQKDIDAYIDGLDGSDDILAADKAGKGMIIHIDANPNGNDGQDLHLMQEAYGRGPQASTEGKSEQVTKPGQVITPQQAQDAANGFTQQMQQRADARQAIDRHQNNPLDPMSRMFNPGVVATGAAQNAAIPQQAGVEQVPQVADMAGLTEALNRTKKAVDEAAESEADKKAREKREKRQALLAKIGDGLGAFHEAYSHMMGQKPMTSGSLSAAQEARVEALGLKRDKKYKDALDNYLKVIDMQRKNDYYNSLAETRKAQQESLDRDRTEKRKMQQEKNQAYINLMEAKRQNELEKSDYYTAYLNALNSGADIETAKAYANQEVVRLANEREAADAAVKQSKVDANKAQANQRNAAANASNARAAKTMAGGSAGGTVTTTSDKVVYDKKGNVKGRTVTTTTKKNGGGSGRSSSKNNSGKKKTGVNWNK